MTRIGKLIIHFIYSKQQKRFIAGRRFSMTLSQVLVYVDSTHESHNDVTFLFTILAVLSFVVMVFLASVKQVVWSILYVAFYIFIVDVRIKEFE